MSDSQSPDLESEKNEAVRQAEEILRQTKEISPNKRIHRILTEILGEAPKDRYLRGGRAVVDPESGKIISTTKGDLYVRVTPEELGLTDNFVVTSHLGISDELLPKSMEAYKSNRDLKVESRRGFSPDGRELTYIVVDGTLIKDNEMSEKAIEDSDHETKQPKGIAEEAEEYLRTVKGKGGGKTVTRHYMLNPEGNTIITEQWWENTGVPGGAVPRSAVVSIEVPQDFWNKVYEAVSSKTPIEQNIEYSKHK